MKVLVTGAAGFIGSHLVERLLERGDEVVGLDNFDQFYEPDIKERNLERARASLHFSEVRGDIRDPEVYAGLPHDIDTVVHLAARAGVRPSIKDPHLYLDVNVRGTLLLLDQMRLRGIPRLIFASSSSVYGNNAPTPFTEEHAGDRPISPYAATKRAGELLVHAQGHLYGIDALVLRFFTVYGPRQRPDLAIHRFAQLLREGKQIPMYGDGTTERDYTYIDDILDGVEGAIDFLGRSPGTYEIVNLGGARTVTLAEMIDRVAAAMGTTPSIVQMHEQPGDVHRTSADISKAERLFGFRPSTPFEEGIRRFVEWFETEREPVAAGRVA